MNDSIGTIYLWPVAIIIFSTLFFASYNIQTANTVISSINTTVIDANTTVETYVYGEDDISFREAGLSWLWLGMNVLSVVLFVSDLFKFMKDNSPNINPNKGSNIFK